MATYPELNGKVAVVSGATGNLGSAVVRRLRADGVKLALMDRNEDRVRQLARDLSIPDDSVVFGAVDLLQKQAVDDFAAKVAATFGRIDIVVHTAGGFKPGAPVHELTEEQWDSLVDLNAKTTFFLAGAVARQMVARKTPGRIVSVAGRASLKGDAGSAAYSVGKTGALRVVESMAAELLEHGITVNAVLPSTIDTPQNRQAWPDWDFSKWVSPESLADVIAFLCSDSARDISGAAIPVYGRS